MTNKPNNNQPEWIPPKPISADELLKQSVDEMMKDVFGIKVGTTVCKHGTPTDKKCEDCK